MSATVAAAWRETATLRTIIQSNAVKDIAGFVAMALFLTAVMLWAY